MFGGFNSTLAEGSHQAAELGWPGTGKPSLLRGGKATLSLSQLLQRENSAALSPSCPEPDSANAPSSAETNPASLQDQRDFSSSFSFPCCFQRFFSPISTPFNCFSSSCRTAGSRTERVGLLKTKHLSSGSAFKTGSGGNQTSQGIQMSWKGAWPRDNSTS